MRPVTAGESSARAEGFGIPGFAAVRIRPMAPSDVEHLRDYIGRLSRLSRHNRFLGGVNELSERELQRFAHADHRRQITLIAEVCGEHGCQIIAEAPCAVANEQFTCEFAISVADEWQRRGIGTLLLDNIQQCAADFGARRLVADSLLSNHAVRHLTRKAGFAVCANAGDARLMRLEKVINTHASHGCEASPVAA
jgi:acetyltransferase